MVTILHDRKHRRGKLYRIGVLGIRVAERASYGEHAAQFHDRLQVEAGAAGLAEVTGVLEAARRQGYVLLDVLPLYVVSAGIQHKAIPRTEILATNLVTPVSIGAVRGRHGRQADLAQSVPGTIAPLPPLRIGAAN